MKRSTGPASLLLACALSAMSLGSQAVVINATDVLANWTAGGSPIDGQTVGAWVASGTGIDGTGNHVGSLLSDFTAVGAYDFSVDVSHSDNDTFGIIWGAQDLGNHYRMSWAQNFGENGTGTTPGTGFDGVFDGFKIVKEVGGVSSLLFSSNTEYVQNQTYNLMVTGTNTGFDILVTLGASTIFDLSFADTTFSSGKVGIHDYFQDGTGRWSNFNFNQGEIPEPATLALLGLGLAGVGFSRRKKSAR